MVLNSLAGEFADARCDYRREASLHRDGQNRVRDAQVAAQTILGWFRAFDLMGVAGPQRIAQMLAGAVELFKNRSCIGFQQAHGMRGTLRGVSVLTSAPCRQVVPTMPDAWAAGTVLITRH